MKMKFALDEGAFAPSKAHESDAGFDLKTPYDFVIKGNGSATINTGIHTLIPNGFVGMIKSKSGLNVKHGLVAEGVVDAGYTGSIVVKLYNNTNIPYKFKCGDKITQLVVLPIPNIELEEVDSLENIETERGDNGFGSSGK